jgi:membrane-associated protease RseP (regulator of RpoE activity)
MMWCQKGKRRVAEPNTLKSNMAIVVAYHRRIVALYCGLLAASWWWCDANGALFVGAAAFAPHSRLYPKGAITAARGGSRIGTNGRRSTINTPWIISKQQPSLRQVVAVNPSLSSTALPAVATAMATLSSVAQPLGSLAILAFIVLVHESGHFLAAKNFGITVSEFSIGFGPKLLGFARKPNNDDTDKDNDDGMVEEFNLRALPLGGYVRFPENYNITQARLVELEDLKASEDFIRQRQPTLGAQVANALTLGFLEDKLWNEEKQRRLQAAAMAMEQTSVPWWKPWARQQSRAAASAVNVAVPEIEYYDDPNLLQNRPWFERAVVLCGGVVFNLLLAFFIYFGQINVGPGIVVPTFADGIVVTANPTPNAAASGKLRQGDVILQVNGLPVTASSSPSPYEAQRAVSNFIATIRATPEGQSLQLTVLHPNEQKPSLIVVQPQRQGDSGMRIGASLSPNFVQTQRLQTSNPIDAARLAAQYAASLTAETASGLASFGASLVFGSSGGSGGGGGGMGQVSGPLGLIQSGSSVVATRDWSAVLLFTAAISINLGVINSFPLPALDGGQLLFVLTEAVTGRKVNQRFQERLTGIAVLFLVFVTASTFVGDLTSIVQR